MELANTNFTTLSNQDLMKINGGGPITSTSLILGAFGVASAGIAIGLAVGAAYYYSTH
ncbi:MAG: Blp family class II bacteriocin [Halanaerobiales bacterium]|nr:Blp family class II bacteriocin [Halanaerobiales bacterium]